MLTASYIYALYRLDRLIITCLPRSIAGLSDGLGDALLGEAGLESCFDSGHSAFYQRPLGSLYHPANHLSADCATLS
jgi:hypothetical protein